MELADRILEKARYARGKDFGDWPGWSTGEILMVALVLNRPDVLADLNWTMVEAFDRVDLNAGQLRAIERQLRDA